MFRNRNTKKSLPKFVNLWKMYRIKIFIISSIVFIFICYMFYNETQGTWSENFSIDPSVFEVNGVQFRNPFPKESKGEKICRAYLEKTFMKPFPKCRPDFLKNEITGQNLEIDCFNRDLMLGVEYNGRQHEKYTPGMHKNYQDFQLQLYRDEQKARKCKELGINLIVIPHTIPHQSISNYIREQLLLMGYID